MLVIVVAIITQGARVAPELRGDLKGSLLVRSGVFPAIGVISFGRAPLESLYAESADSSNSFCLP